MQYPVDARNQSTFPIRDENTFLISRETCARKSPHKSSMPATDLVPCFYTGQNYRVEKPAEVRTRAEVREFKAQKLGSFIENGRVFLFFKKLVQKAQQIWDGPFGVGNLLPFYKSQNPLIAPQKIHYQTPPAGAVGMRKWGMRSVSGIFWNEGFMRENKSIRTRTIKVSARKIDLTAAAYISSTQNRGVIPAQPPVVSSLMQFA